MKVAKDDLKVVALIEEDAMDRKESATVTTNQNEEPKEEV